MNRASTSLTGALLVLLAMKPGSSAAMPAVGSVAVPATCSGPLAAFEGAPDYYAIELVTTGRVPGTSRATGTADVTFARSPFGLALTPAGEYEYDLAVSLQGVATQTERVYAVWVTTPQLDDVEFVGLLDEDLSVSGRVSWNKFLVVVSLERADGLGERWQGPIVLRGTSRSGRMHTMAGHGPYEIEPCVKYGY